MTDTRSELALGHRSVVVSASGLLARFNDAGVLDPLDVLSASVIARICDEPEESVALAAAMTVRGTRLGHVCIRIPTLRDAVVVDGQAPDIIDTLPWPDSKEWDDALAGSALVGDGTGDEPMVLAGDRLYLERYFRYEEQVAEMIIDRLGRDTVDVGLRENIDRFLPLPTRQRAAISLALGARLAVIAGGPGTGKTHTVAALLGVLASATTEEFPRVALCAPTGKAAARLGEAVAELAAGTERPIQETLAEVEASTIHRLLGWRWGRGRFAHDARHRLPHDLVVVDEMSMVSLPLAAKLLSAVRDDATVVLVGDPFQLESIEAGTVLADIVGPATEPPVDPSPLRDHVVVLDRTHRYDEDSIIADFADAVRGGDPDGAIDVLARGRAELRWVADQDSPEFAELWATVVAQRTRMVELASTPGRYEAALGTLSDVAVLCARREGPDSVTRWRRRIESVLDERFVGLRYGGEWYPGRPVMVTRNDYTLGLYNGDIGVAVETDAGFQVVFDRGGVRLFPLGYLGEHTTVHAMTIHKSQGSQFREVVVVLPGEASRLLTRELLYTAVTRASQRVWVVGEEAVIRAAIGRSVPRASGLGLRLWGADQAGKPPEPRSGKNE